MAISCLLDKGLTKADFCGYSLKQIVEVYLANFAQVSTVTFTDADDKGNGYELEGITMVDNAKWYKVEVAKDTASYNDDLVVGGNGSKYRTHTMTFSFNGAYSAELAKVLDELSLGKFVAILKLSDGSYVMLGRLTGLEASAASSLSEAAADGQNGITVTLECNTTEAAVEVPATVFDTLSKA